MGAKWGPNRIFDAEALRKPLGGLLERSWRLLEPKKVTLEASWSRLGGLTEIDGRSRRGQGGTFRWPWPLGSATIKDYLVRNNDI